MQTKISSHMTLTFDFYRPTLDLVTLASILVDLSHKDHSSGQTLATADEQRAVCGSE